MPSRRIQGVAQSSGGTQTGDGLFELGSQTDGRSLGQPPMQPLHVRLPCPQLRIRPQASPVLDPRACSSEFGFPKLYASNIAALGC